MERMSALSAAVQHELGVRRTAVPARRVRNGAGARRAPREASPLVAGAMASAVLSDPTPLIDRKCELESIRTQLLSQAVRLVTLTGPGGIGKTRLAVAAAECLEAAFPDGVRFVDLAPLRDPDEFDAALARSLKLDEGNKQFAAERVAAYLRHHSLLLVLDNFEHLVAATPRVAALLAAAPKLKVLVTSREPLNLRLEHRVPLPPLPVPDLRTSDPATVAQAPAAALFLHHALRLQQDFALTPASAQSLAALLRRLDGIPLAIQIAAGQSHVLSPAAMLARLEGHVLLSTEEGQDAPTRHHTLRQAIDWSYGLLTATEQSVFRRLGVFVGGCTLEAVEAVLQEREPASPRSNAWGSPEAPTRKGDALTSSVDWPGRRDTETAQEDVRASPVWATLGRLVDKSLVQVETFRGSRRYRMLEPIREYALERLTDTGEVETDMEGHAVYYLALAERAAPEVWPTFEDATWRELEAEYENFLAALRWAAGRGDGKFSLRLAGALAGFWIANGHVEDGRRWLEAARALGSTAPPVMLARALLGEGILAFFQGDYARSCALLQDTLTLVEPLHDPALAARILSSRGIVLAFQGNTDGAQALLDRGLALSRKTGDRYGTAFALIYRGRIFAALEDLERAERASQEALDVARSADVQHLIGFALANLSQLRLRRRDYSGAASLGAEGLRVARATGYRRLIRYVVAIAALVADQHGDLARAAQLCAATNLGSDWGQTAGPIYHDPAAHAALRDRARTQMGETKYSEAVAAAQALSVEQVTDLAQAALELTDPGDAQRTTAARDARATASRPLLSDREQAVLRMISEGLPNKQIARELGIAERTVKSHVSSAMSKLGVDNRAHAAVTAVQRGLL